MVRRKKYQNSILVELHVPDFERAKDFYEKLGFEVVWERKPDGNKGYLVMRRGNSILCFWSGNDEVWNQSYFKQFPRTTKRGYAVEIVIMVENIESVYKECKKFAKVVEDLTAQPWGLHDFRIEDPFGFYIRITEPHDVTDPKYAVQ